MFNKTKAEDFHLYCQIWFENKTAPVISKVVDYRMIWFNEWGNDSSITPFLVSCNIPKDNTDADKTTKTLEIPKIVSIVSTPCENAENALKIHYKKPTTKKNFAVCVKDLNFYRQDLSVRLTEWLELLKLLGASKVYFYERHIHPNIRKLLQYYTEDGFVESTKIKLAGNRPNVPLLQEMYLRNKSIITRKHEVISYNDCFYKHMNEYKFIALLDIDEIIVPTDGDWADLMFSKDLQETVNKIGSNFSSYAIRNVYFLDKFMEEHGNFAGIPKHMHLLQHVYRSRKFTKKMHFVKCFHNTEVVLTIHNHFALSCLGDVFGACNYYHMDKKIVKLHHYRADCVKDVNCEEYQNNPVLDTTLWRFKDDLISNVDKVLKILGFLS